MFIVKEINRRKGLYATMRIGRGRNIGELSSGEVSDKRTRTSIQIGKDLHSEHPWAKFMNHSFNPNCAIDGTEVITIRQVEPEEELTFDYTSNEDEISNPFQDLETGRWVGSPHNDEEE